MTSTLASSLPLAFMDIGFGEMVVVAFVALLLFGGRLPEMMRKFGASYREFKRGLEDVTKNPITGIKPPGSSMPYRPSLPSFLQSRTPDASAPKTYAPMPAPTPDPLFAKPAPPAAPPPVAPPRPPPAAPPSSHASDDDAPFI